MIIGDHNIDERVLIVAEIGNNHEGSYALAEDMVCKAAEAGADAVKFQTFRTEHYVGRADTVRFARLKQFELQFEEFSRLSERARQHGLLFLSTPFDLGSADFLNEIVSAFKVSSSDNMFYPLLDRVAGFGKPILLSTGLVDIATIEKSVTQIQLVWQEQGFTDLGLALLHCVSSYPVAPEDANLAAITTLEKEFSCTIGYSDHTLGINAAVLAVALGARIIEKHFTIDKNYSDFRDHQLSADPAEMRELVDRIRETEVLLGSGEKKPAKSEKKAEHVMRRSIVAARDLSAGRVIEFEDLTWVRPGGGMSPGDEGLLLGRKLRHALMAGDTFSIEHIEES